MKCKYEYCHNEAQGSGAYCSNSCRAQHSRRNKSSATLESSATSEAQHPSATWPDGSTEPIEVKAFGPIETAEVMSCRTLIDVDTPCILTQTMIDSLPIGVSRPTAQPDAGTAKLTAQELRSKVSNYIGPQWKHSTEYAEVIYRLITWTKQELIEAGQTVPQWKAA